MANVVLLQGKRTTFELPQTPLKYFIQKFQTNHKAISIKAIRTACLDVFTLNQKVEKYKSRLAISCSLMIFADPLCFSLLLPDSLMIFSIAPALLWERISGPNRSKTLMFFSMTSFRRITPYIIYNNETIQIYCRDI